jgi:hypothetical protein
MLVLVSGEGHTDIGVTAPNRDDGEPTFLPGPMAHVVDQMIESAISYSVIEFGFVRHLGRVELSNLAKELPIKPRFVMPGSKRPQGNAGDYRQAFALAQYASWIESSENDEVLTVLFRDSDGTCSSTASKWQDLVNSIEAAFAAAKYVKGVAMVAKPKQEAWFLCALKKDGYVACHSLEEESGNDNSPIALKKKVEEALGRAADREVLINLVLDRKFDHSKIDMPSFNAFRDALFRAINKITR